MKAILCRRRAASRPLGDTFRKLNYVLRGWINYFRIGSMKTWLKDNFGPWMRHKVRVVILKQWKRSQTMSGDSVNPNFPKKGTKYIIA